MPGNREPTDEIHCPKRCDTHSFHQMGRFKWDKLGIDYKLEHVEPPSAEVVERVCEQFRAAGLKTY